MSEQRKRETTLIHKVLEDSGFPSLKLKQIFVISLFLITTQDLLVIVKPATIQN